MRLSSVVVGIALLASVGGTALADAQAKRLTDNQIRKLLIEESIAAYSGNCPCPYSRARNGSRCGRRSAHSRAGGEAPLCFDSDVSREMVQAYRDAHADE